MKTYLYITPFFPLSNDRCGAYCLNLVKAITLQLELKVGDGEWRVEVLKLGDVADYEWQCKECGLKNVAFHGPVSHDKLKEILKDVQLHIFPSRADGFPKVTLETAAAGVPSLVYDDYGANEWITTGKDGFVVKTIDEMAGVVQGLLDKPESLQPLADNARELAKRFDWKALVKDWEKEIIMKLVMVKMD